MMGNYRPRVAQGYNILETYFNVMPIYACNVNDGRLLKGEMLGLTEYDTKRTLLDVTHQETAKAGLSSTSSCFALRSLR